MKSYNNLYFPMLEEENIIKCIKAASKGKRKRYDVRQVLSEAERHAKRIKHLISSGEFHFTNYRTAIINCSTEKKERLIAKPRFRYDQIVHHVIMSVFKPIVMKGLYEHAYGSIPNRGPHTAKRFLEKWIRSFKNKRFYVLKCDIKHFYDSINHEILKKKLGKVIRDKKYLEILYALIDSYSPGLPKGFYSSQWFANFYLTPFDHFIKEVLKAPYYLRYMDDIVILSPNKRKLHKIKEGLEQYLNDELDLQLKENWQIYRFVDRNDQNGRDIDFMGFRFYRHKTTLRKSSLRRIRRKANRLAKKRAVYQTGEGQGTTVHDCQSMLSYLGWTTHTDVYQYYQRWIKPKINKRRLRKKISVAAKRAALKNITS